MLARSCRYSTLDSACSISKRTLGVDLEGTRLDHQSPSIPPTRMSRAGLLCGPIRSTPHVRAVANAGTTDMVWKIGPSTLISSIWPLEIAIISTRMITPIDHTRVRGDRYDP